LALAGCLALAVATAGAAFAHVVLVRDDGEAQAEVLIVLGGGRSDRALHAAELMQHGVAPLALISGFGDCETNRQRLIQQQISPGAIEVECDSRSTRENALRSIELLRSRHIRKAILVTSWYHSRRVLACFRKYAPDIQFKSRPSYYGYQVSEWLRTDMVHHVFAEYVKLAGYWVCYGVSPS
jgi:uncharacterized SAM-binding protein YcdF (DUF218 family)